MYISYFQANFLFQCVFSGLRDNNNNNGGIYKVYKVKLYNIMWRYIYKDHHRGYGNTGIYI